MRVKLYSVEAPEQQAEIIRGTAKVAMRRVRELHRQGIPATFRLINNRAEQRAATQ